jgi:hypothetical protein
MMLLVGTGKGQAIGVTLRIYLNVAQETLQHGVLVVHMPRQNKSLPHSSQAAFAVKYTK